MKKKSKKTNSITLDDVLAHIQGLGMQVHAVDSKVQNLDMKIDNIKNELKSDLKKMDEQLSYKISRLDIKLTTQIDGIDSRLDAIEIDNLPKRITRLEQEVFFKRR